MYNNIRWYSLNKDLETQDNEIINYEKSCEIIDQYLGSQKYIKEKADNNDNLSGEEVMTKSMFGFYVENHKDTFLQIDMDSSESFRIKFEYDGDSKKFLFLTFGLYQKEYFVSDINDLKNIVRNFYEKNLVDFKEYFDKLDYEMSE